MFKKIITFFCLLHCFLIRPQGNIELHGTILANETIKSDTIFFIPELFIDKKYYKNQNLRSAVVKNEFFIRFNTDYPQMYMISLDSERKAGKLRFDICFLDNSTTEISFNSVYKLKKSNGLTNKEFLTKFIPFIFEEKKEDFHLFNFDRNLDERLYKYIQENPDSYVALWFLIVRFNKEGYNELYEKCLNSFSKKMKNENLWKILNEEISVTTVRFNHKFPEIVFKNIDLNPEVLEIPEAEYTLIDFWFSRCRPCLEAIPKFIDLYRRYNSNGFNIISISTDKTENVRTYWQKRVIEKEIPWKNYLDENAVFASKEKINSFPTNFLLNSKGEVIKKNIQMEELEELLINTYKIKKHFDNYDRQPQVPVSIF